MTKKRARTQRRADERALDKLVHKREQAARKEPGGAPDTPIPVGSASEVEAHGRGHPCPVCGDPLRVLDHRAVVSGGRSLRVLSVECRGCGRSRELFFEISARLLS